MQVVNRAREFQPAGNGIETYRAGEEPAWLVLFAEALEPEEEPLGSPTGWILLDDTGDEEGQLVNEQQGLRIGCFEQLLQFFRRSSPVELLRLQFYQAGL